MCESIQVDETILKLMKLVEEKDIAIKELGGKVEGYSTVTKFLLERLNHNLVETRIHEFNLPQMILSRLNLRVTKYVIG